MENNSSHYSNSAKRILNILKTLNNQPGNLSAAKVWAQTLGLESDNIEEDTHEIHKKLGLLRTELDLVEMQMMNTSFSKELYLPYIKDLKKIFSPSNILAEWNSYSQHINGTNLLMLGYCSEILADEDSIDFEELENLLSKLHEFKSAIENSNINNASNNFIINQINIIQQAINDYPISGNKVLINSFDKGIMEIIKNQELISEPENKNHTNKMLDIFNEFREVTKNITDIDKTVSSCLGLINKGSALLEIIGKNLLN